MQQMIPNFVRNRRLASADVSQGAGGLSNIRRMITSENLPELLAVLGYSKNKASWHKTICAANQPILQRYR
jgi:hypothetical protein